MKSQKNREKQMIFLQIYVTIKYSNESDGTGWLL